MLPLEICTVPEGQQMRKAIPKGKQYIPSNVL